MSDFSKHLAIDGDTAQVGPQVAEKLALPQVTYAEELVDIKDGEITIKRRLENHRHPYQPRTSLRRSSP